MLVICDGGDPCLNVLSANRSYGGGDRHINVEVQKVTMPEC